ncbi:zona pellucida-like domain-containing protein 1 [Chanos chanos]|uniref:Zona pellucida-like domain-containing protein 1 n=1 Tax=Chanos chanos TaxID=29144 RepID=A0A6J2WXF5_CHACN|nr:zona pellucida-like domain-containing protein 1 [Chanos chanos]
MWLGLLLYQLALILPSEAQNVCSTHPTLREAANSDVTVTCGTDRMMLEILLCPVYFGGYNESLMALNAKYNQPECKGTPDWTVDPPVLKFNFSLTEEAIAVCSNKLMITQEVGTGLFSDFSSIQFVNISGMINSFDPSAGTITYHQEIMYIFSCRYPLQYLINNTEMSVSGVSLAIKYNNGSFISTLSMQLYEDNSYTSKLQIPHNGLRLKTRIFVEVRATNLTQRFNVLLDRCYATTSPYPINSTYYDLFVGCNRDGQTVIALNGESQVARFSFEAFRFVEHKNKTVSTFYLHCATRLCERTFCNSLHQNCSGNGSRRKRETQSAESTSVTDVAMVTSGPIRTVVDNGEIIVCVSVFSGQSRSSEAVVVGVSVAAGILGLLCVVMVTIIINRAHWTKSWSTDKSVLFH